MKKTLFLLILIFSALFLIGGVSASLMEDDPAEDINLDPGYDPDTLTIPPEDGSINDVEDYIEKDPDNSGNSDTRTNCPTEGLVPCGTEGCPCTLCDLFVMFSRIINYALFRIVPVVAVLMVAIGGFMFMLAYAGKGGPDTLSKARTLLKSVAIGLILIYAAWIIINGFFMIIGVNEWTGLKDGWWKIDCESSAPSSGSSLYSSPDSNTPSPEESSAGPQHTTPTREKPETGEIISVSDKVDSAWIGSDEITVNTQVKNTSNEPKKYRAILWNGEGGVPVQGGDWVTIEPGESKTIEVSTDWKGSSIDDLTKDHYTITVSEEGGETIGRVSRPVPSH